MPKLNPALLYLIIAAIIWGATVPIMKIALREIPIFSLAILRMGIASILLLPFVYKDVKIQRADIPLMLLVAFLGTNLNLTFFFFGVEHSPGINASAMTAILPVLTLFLAHIYLKEKLSKKLLAGAVLALFGTLVIIGIPIFNLDLMSTLGSLSLLASTLAWVGYELISKKALKKYKPLTVTFFTMALGALFFIPAATSDLINFPNWYNHLSKEGVLGLLYGIIFASFVAYSFWQKGLAKTTAGQASFTFYLLPISGILFSFLLLGEKFTLFSIIGAAIILAGVILGEYHRKSRQHTQ